MRFTTTMSSSEVDTKVGGVESGANDDASGTTTTSSNPSSASSIVTNGSNDSSSAAAHHHHHGHGHGQKDLSGGDKSEDDFSDYLWMENMEEYDQEIMRQLEEDILISHYTDLYEDSLLEDGSAGPTTASLCVVNGPILAPFGDPAGDDLAGDDLADVTRQFHRAVNLNNSSSGSSRLNPNAAEFVPKQPFGNVSYQH